MTNRLKGIVVGKAEHFKWEGGEKDCFVGFEEQYFAERLPSLLPPHPYHKNGTKAKVLRWLTVPTTSLRVRHILSRGNLTAENSNSP
jgi:hypothetical protein